jgi:hypothetical protein
MLTSTVTNSTVTVNPNVAEDFALGKLHKEIATSAMALVKDSEASDSQLQQVRGSRNSPHRWQLAFLSFLSQFLSSFSSLTRGV